MTWRTLPRRLSAGGGLVGVDVPRGGLLGGSAFALLPRLAAGVRVFGVAAFAILLPLVHVLSSPSRARIAPRAPRRPR